MSGQTPLESCLYVGKIRHRRYRPVTHGFGYRLFWAYLDLSELDQVFAGRWLWSTRRIAAQRFRRSDYLGPVDRPLDTAVRDVVESELGRRPKGPIRMLTQLRALGLLFNPVTFYYCFDPKRPAHLDAIVAEITNTPWGERSGSRDAIEPVSDAKIERVGPWGHVRRNARKWP